MRTLRGALAVLLVLALAGCVNIPTSGPVDKVEGQQPACQSCVNVEVAPPAVGMSASEVVEGFLRANANYQPGYSVARQFMTEAAAASWSTDQGATIFSGSTTQQGDDTVSLKGKVVGDLSQGHTFRAKPRPLDITFDLEREKGEWRISNQLSGLFVRDSAFETLYRSYDLYFVGASGALVPEPIYLPDLRAPGNVASALVKALLTGPSDWLSTAVSTGVPAKTTLSVDSVTIANGVAQVPLSDAVQQATDAQRTLLAAQLGYTLQQVTGVRKIQLVVNNQSFRVPQSEDGDFAVPLDALSPDLDPVPLVPAEQLYAARTSDQALLRLNANTDRAVPEPFPGALGEGRYAVDSLGVSVRGDELALVTDMGTTLRRTPTSSTDVTTVLDGVTGLLRPQFSRTDELFAVGEQQGQQKMWVSTPKGRTELASATEVFSAGRVRAFRVSPDGARMALIVTSKGKTHLALARIVRSSKVSVEGYQVLDTTSSSTTATAAVTRDLVWTSATELLVLAADTTRGPFVPTTVSIDASVVEAQPLTEEWDAQELTALLRPQTSIPVVLAADGRAYRDDGARWQFLLGDLGAIAYPG